jgi:chromosomal replication initiator protein
MLTENLAVINPSPSPWQKCLDLIQEKIGVSSFETWFRTTEMDALPDGSVSINVPNQFFADFIEEHFGGLIREALAALEIACSTLRFVPIKKDWAIIQPVADSIAEAQNRCVPKAVERTGRFHTNYTFEKFVVGDSNRMAHAAALAVAEAPGKTSFNPLIVYGGTGLGKTHLLQAIGNFAEKEETAEKIVYLTSEEFTNQYISYIIDKKDSTSFFKKFIDVDLLLIDDIQFFGGKPATQKEFYRIFNKLLLESKQIVLSSDRPPDQIKDMMTHIINRFMSGLVTDIQPPNLETRMAILRKKAELDGLSLPGAVIEHIASHITSNVRELEGILIKLIASCSFTGRDITIDVAREICGDIVARNGERISIRLIQQKVADSFNISANQLNAHTRKRDVTLPRYIAMYLAKKWTRQSLRTIGLEFGGRDYSTIIHAFKKIENDQLQSPELQARVEAIEEVLRPLA